MSRQASRIMGDPEGEGRSLPKAPEGRTHCPVGKASLSGLGSRVQGVGQRETGWQL